MASQSTNKSPLTDVLRIMNQLSAVDLTPKAQRMVTGLFADHKFMEHLLDISDMAYGKIDTDLVQYLGTHSIVPPDTADCMLRRVIVAYLIACKQGDCAAALYKFRRAYDMSITVNTYPYEGRAPCWMLKMLATE